MSESSVCVVCARPAISKSIYCARCRNLIATKAESTKRRAALIDSYDKSLDVFRCHWSGVILEETDWTDPFHLCFDHLLPVRFSGLVASSELFNSMKTDLAPDEFRGAIGELAAHRAGRPFDRDCVEFEYWTERAAPPPVPRLRREERTAALSSDCAICGHESFRHSIYCPRCRRFVFWGGHDHVPRVEALKRAWSPEQDGFLCQYTGVRLDDSDPGSAWYLNLDHRVPGDETTLAVAAAWVNAMKTDLSEDEFSSENRPILFPQSPYHLLRAS